MRFFFVKTENKKFKKAGTNPGFWLFYGICIILILYGGAGGSRTRVRKYIHLSFSECSHCLLIRRQYPPMTEYTIC